MECCHSWMYIIDLRASFRKIKKKETFFILYVDLYELAIRFIKCCHVRLTISKETFSSVSKIYSALDVQGIWNLLGSHEGV